MPAEMNKARGALRSIKRWIKGFDNSYIVLLKPSKINACPPDKGKKNLWIMKHLWKIAKMFL